MQIKKLRVQRRFFRNSEWELTKAEYLKLIETTYSKGKERIGNDMCHRHQGI